ncbi:hypothetical protein ACWD4O_35400 [Streptomyces sp. NPDC002623]
MVLPHGTVLRGEQPEEDVVGPLALDPGAPDENFSSDEEEITVLSTAQPAPPVVRQVVPLFRWDAPATDQSRRRGNAVRICLERPWWSSGAGEKLGVVLVSSSTEPPQALRPYLTMQGVDPTVTDFVLPPYPRLASLPRTAESATGVTLAEVSGTTVTIAGHDVSFDAARDLWYADVELVAPNGTPLAAWLPFVRLALVRYQPHSLDGYSVSKVVQAPLVQLSPERKATLVRGSGTATVSVRGPAYTGTSAAASSRPSVRAVVEQANPAVPDPHLRWEEIAGSAVTLTATGSSAQTTWTAQRPAPHPTTYRLHRRLPHQNRSLAGHDNSTERSMGPLRAGDLPTMSP